MANQETGDPLDALAAEVAAMAAKADEAAAQLREATATVASPDGAVELTVAPSGTLTNIRFGQRAYERSPEQLSALVMKLLGKGQRAVSAKMAEAFAGLVGENSAAMNVLTDYLPAPEEDEDEAAGQPPKEWPPAQQEAPEPEQPSAQRGPTAPRPPQPSAPPAAQPPAPQPERRPDQRPRRGPARPADEGDDDFSNPW